MERKEQAGTFSPIEKSNSDKDGYIERPKIKIEAQIIEGIIREGTTLEQCLPSGVTPKMVDQFLGSDGKWHWHLRPEYIEDEQKRREYEEERKKWPF